MRISIFTDELALDAAKALPIIAGWGLKTVDFRGMINGRAIHDQTDDELRALKAQMDELGLEMGVLQSSLLKVHLPDEVRLAQEMEKLEGLIRAANILGTKSVRSFFGWQPAKNDYGTLTMQPDMFQRVMDILRPFAKRAREAGLIFGFENCGVSVQETIAVLNTLDIPGWGLAWDVSNHWEQVPGITDPDVEKKYILTSLQHANMVHVKANATLPELPGVKIDWSRILRGVAALQIEDMPVSIETHNNPQESPFSPEEASHRVYQAVIAAIPTLAPTNLEEAIAKQLVFPRSYADNPVRFVVVGLGLGRLRSEQIMNTPGCKLAGVVDFNEATAKAVGEQFGVPWSTDLQFFLDDPDIEVVYITTPTGTHSEIGIRCMRAGKHVLMTKPMDWCTAACNEAIAEAKKQGVLLAVDFDLRYRNPLLSLAEANRSGWFGRILSATVQLKVKRTQQYYDDKGGWRGTFRQDGGGTMSNQGIHEIDRMIAILGMPQKVMGYTATQAHTIEAEDLGSGIWLYENGAVVTFYATSSYPVETWYSRLEIHGTEGAFISEAGGINPAADRWYVNGKWTEIAPCPAEPDFAHGSDNFASAVRLGTPLTAPGEEGAKSRIVLDAMYQSAKSGGVWVDVSSVG